MLPRCCTRKASAFCSAQRQCLLSLTSASSGTGEHQSMQHEREMRSEPMIAVRNVPASACWYAKLLNCENDHGRSDFDRIVSNGQVLLMLHQLEADEHGLNRSTDVSAGNGFLLWIFVADVEAVFRRAKQMNARFLVEPHENPQAGWTEFTVEDPDGYRVAIASWQ